MYLLSGVIFIVIFNGTKLSGNYDVSIIKYIFETLILKILFIFALNALCMCFCYLVRSAVAYCLVILSLGATMLGMSYQSAFVQDNIVVKSIFKMLITVQDQIMFGGRIQSGVYYITGSEIVFFTCVVVGTALLFYKLSFFILKKVEIK